MSDGEDAEEIVAKQGHDTIEEGRSSRCLSDLDDKTLTESGLDQRLGRLTLGELFAKGGERQFWYDDRRFDDVLESTDGEGEAAEQQGPKDGDVREKIATALAENVDGGVDDEDLGELADTTMTEVLDGEAPETAYAARVLRSLAGRKKGGPEETLGDRLAAGVDEADSIDDVVPVDAEQFDFVVEEIAPSPSQRNDDDETVRKGRRQMFGKLTGRVLDNVERGVDLNVNPQGRMVVSKEATEQEEKGTGTGRDATGRGV